MGCGMLSEVHSVENLIDNIGTVTMESGDAIKAAETAYENLSSKKKENVSNYDVLVTAKKEYAKLDIVGTWTAQYLHFHLTYCFYEDGTYENFTDASFAKDTRGTYTYDGNEICFEDGRRVPAKKTGDNTLIVTADDMDVDVVFTKQ